MTKSEAVRSVKLANNRLKPIGESCYGIALQRDNRPPQKLHRLTLARLDRELTPEDSAGPALRDAVDVFWREYFAGVGAERQIALAENVYSAVRLVQSERWSRLESEYGNVSHYFDRFGQIKKQYRQPQGDVEEEIEEPSLAGCAIVAAGMVALVPVLMWLMLF